MSNLRYENAMNGCNSMMSAMRNYLMQEMGELDAYVALRGMLMEAFGNTALKNHKMTDDEFEDLKEACYLEMEDLKTYGKEANKL